MTTESQIEAIERRWAYIVVLAVSVILAVVVLSSFLMAIHPPGHVETIDASTLAQNKEFAESNLGTQVNPDGSAIVRIVAAQFEFLPRCIPVPQGRPVTLRVTSADVIHGFLIAGTNANTMVVPGYVSEIHTVFNSAGDHLMPCHEFCGLGHSEMWSVVRVIPQSQWHNEKNGKATCDVSH